MSVGNGIGDGLIFVLRSMFAHAAWANSAILEELQSGFQRDPETRRLLAHLLASEHVWLRRIHGEQPQHTVWPDLNVREVADLAKRNVLGFERLLASVDPEEEPRMIEYATSSGEQFTTALVDILIHVAIHGAYHRGQIASAVRQKGRTPAITDYIAYVRSSDSAA